MQAFSTVSRVLAKNIVHPVTYYWFITCNVINDCLSSYKLIFEDENYTKMMSYSASSEQSSTGIFEVIIFIYFMWQVFP